MDKKWILILACVLFGASTVCGAPVKDTGDPNERVCNPASYTDLGNGIVRDNVTGLEWQQETAPGYTWQQALDYCASLSLGGRSDWRLPSIEELSTLIDSGIPSPGPTINTHYFPDTVASYYWSSTPFAIGTDYAWCVHFYGGRAFFINRSGYISVRAVRGGSYESFGNYVDNGDGTIIDTATGLMWQKATAPDTYTWQGALDYCASLSLGGRSDWRLPTRNELQSLVDYSSYNPATMFSNTVASYYWSSTTYGLNTVSAWYVDFLSGSVNYGNKGNNNYVRAVRGGLCRGCIDNADCSEGYGCAGGVCVVDNPPEIGDGPFLAAGSWPLLRTSPLTAFALDQNYGVLWTFSDDYAACSELCTHAAEYQIIGGEDWISLTVHTDPDGTRYAYVDLPVEQLQHAATFALRFSVTDCRGQTTHSDIYYFRVAFYDNPPVIGDGPFLAAGPWPVLPTSPSRAFALDRNYSILWTFSDDYASCVGPCAHRARYRLVGDGAWTWIPVSSHPAGFALTELPIDTMDEGIYQFRFDVRDCAGQITYSRSYYFEDTTPCCTFAARVASSSDDGMERKTNGQIVLCGVFNTLTMLDLNLGLDDDFYSGYSACNQQSMLTGIRFSDVQVPRSIDRVPVVIRNAYIEFTARTNHGNSLFRRRALTLDITAEAADNPLNLGTSDYNISSRPDTAASVVWSVPGGTPYDEWIAGVTYATPDLTPIVQEIISRPGWQSGNAMLFKIDHIDGNGGRVAHSFDSNPHLAPRLVIEYGP